MQVSNSSHLIGNFNNHLRDLVFLFADEAFYANDKKHESILKTLITEDTLTIERKGHDVETSPNCIHLVMASNDIHVIPAGSDERRFFVLDVGSEKQNDSSYFGAIMREMEGGGYEALLHYLRTLDLTDYNVRRVPETEALKEQKLLSLHPDEDWWLQKLIQGQLLDHREGWPESVVARDLQNDYIDYAQRHRLQKRSSETKLGRFLVRVVPKVKRDRRNALIEIQDKDGVFRKQRMRTSVYDLSGLQVCRNRWDKLYGDYDWPEEIESDADEAETPF